MFGAGIAIQTMINSLKNNLRRRPRKNYFESHYSATVGKSKVNYELMNKKASPELLEKIRLEAVKDRKQRLKKGLLALIIGIILTILFIQFLLKHFLSLLL